MPTAMPTDARLDGPYGGFQVDVLFAGAGYSASVWHENPGVSVESLWEIAKLETMIQSQLKKLGIFPLAKQPGDVSSYSYVGDRIVDGSVPCLSITGEGPKQGCNVGQTAEYHELVRMVRELHREQNRRVRMLLVENVEKGARAAYVGEPCFSQQLVTAITAYGYNCWWRTIGARSFGPLVRNRTFYVFVPANQTFFGRSIVWGDVVPEAPPLSDDRFITIDTRWIDRVHRGCVRDITRSSNVYVKRVGSRGVPTGPWRQMSKVAAIRLWGGSEDLVDAMKRVELPKPKPEKTRTAFETLGAAQCLHSHRWLVRRLLQSTTGELPEVTRAPQEVVEFDLDQHTWPSHGECLYRNTTTAGGSGKGSWPVDLTRYVDCGKSEVPGLPDGEDLGPEAKDGMESKLNDALKNDKSIRSRLDDISSESQRKWAIRLYNHPLEAEGEFVSLTKGKAKKGKTKKGKAKKGTAKQEVEVAQIKSINGDKMVVTKRWLRWTYGGQTAELEETEEETLTNWWTAVEKTERQYCQCSSCRRWLPPYYSQEDRRKHVDRCMRRRGAKSGVKKGKRPEEPESSSSKRPKSRK